jgi:hypothetical protein
MSAIAFPAGSVSKLSTALQAPLWPVRELVILGVFSAAAKVSTLMVALIGGGMNPVTLLAKNCIFTTLLIIVLFKVRKPGTLLLFSGINFLVSMLLLGGSVTLLVPLVAAACVAEVVTGLFGGIARPWGPFVSVAVFDLLFKILSLGISWLFSRENPAMLYVVVPFVIIGYAGSVIGLFTGYKSVKELRRAGLAAY